MKIFRCADCETPFDHPNVQECKNVGGYCEWLVCAGWKPVWIRVSFETVDGEKDRHIFSRGAWICSKCAAKYVAPRPVHKRRIRRRNHRNHDRELS